MEYTPQLRKPPPACPLYSQHVLLPTTIHVGKLQTVEFLSAADNLSFPHRKNMDGKAFVNQGAGKSINLITELQSTNRTRDARFHAFLDLCLLLSFKLH